MTCIKKKETSPNKIWVIYWREMLLDRVWIEKKKYYPKRLK